MSPKLPSHAPSEKQIQNEILDVLAMIRFCFAWPNQSTGIFDPIKKIYRKPNNKHHLNGVSDILGVYKSIPLAIEVKSKTGVLSESQKQFIHRFKQHGGIALVLRSSAQVIFQLETAYKEVVDNSRNGAPHLVTYPQDIHK